MYNFEKVLLKLPKKVSNFSKMIQKPPKPPKPPRPPDKIFWNFMAVWKPPQKPPTTRFLRQNRHPSSVSDQPHGKSPNCQFLDFEVQVWKNQMFLTNPMENRQTAKFLTSRFEFGKTTCFWQTPWKIAKLPDFRLWSSSLEKPHVSDKPPGKSPNCQIFDFEIWVWKNHMFLTNPMENRQTARF